MMRLFVILCGCVVMWSLSSCSYRLASVKPLGEPVRIVISQNAANVVRSQGYLQKEIAAAIQDKLGWHVSPSGSARLHITIDQEVISASGNDTRGITTRWTIELQGSVMLTSKHGTVINRWRAIGYSAGLNDEASALEQAATKASLHITSWLENWIEKQPAQAE